MNVGWITNSFPYFCVADEVKKLLKHLVKEGAVVALAFSKWLELQNDNSVSRKRVLEELGQFVEELARTK